MNLYIVSYVNYGFLVFLLLTLKDYGKHYLMLSAD